jgi:hypothetical protein
MSTMRISSFFMPPILRAPGATRPPRHERHQDLDVLDLLDHPSRRP